MVELERQEVNIQMEIPDHIVKKWQNIVNTMATLIGVPAGLIMRVVGPDIEVFVSSQTKNNPYHLRGVYIEKFRGRF